MICPICGERVFTEKKHDPKMKVINFETRTMFNDKNTSRQKFYACVKCGYKLYGNEITQLRKEMKYLKEVE